MIFYPNTNSAWTFDSNWASTPTSTALSGRLMYTVTPGATASVTYHATQIHDAALRFLRASDDPQLIANVDGGPDILIPLLGIIGIDTFTLGVNLAPGSHTIVFRDAGAALQFGFIDGLATTDDSTVPTFEQLFPYDPPARDYALDYCPRFVYGDTGLLELPLPITPWTKTLQSVGGMIEGDSGMRASFSIRRDQLLNFSLRFFETDWIAVQAFIDLVQLGAPFAWYPDKMVDDFIEVCLIAPAINTAYAAVPDSTYPKVLMLAITLTRADALPFGSAWSGLPDYTTDVFHD